MLRDRFRDPGFNFWRHRRYLLTEAVERFGLGPSLCSKFSNILCVRFRRNPYLDLLPALADAPLTLEAGTGGVRLVSHVDTREWITKKDTS